MLSSRVARMAQSPKSQMTVYLADVSYFSGKMEAYLRYKEIPYERRLATSKMMREEVLPATGLMKVPVIRLPDGRWLKDTTPMIDWFESQQPTPTNGAGERPSIGVGSRSLPVGF